MLFWIILIIKIKRNSKKTKGNHRITERWPVEDVEYTKTIIPIPNRLKDMVNNLILTNEPEETLLNYYSALLLIDSGSNANCISKKLARALECPTYL